MMLASFWNLFSGTPPVQNDDAAESRIKHVEDICGTFLDLSFLDMPQLPIRVVQITNLTTLNLRRNHLTSLPVEIGMLTNLIKLNLTSNWLTSLPSEIGRLTGLTELILKHNKFTSLPTEIGLLTSLKTLELDNNKEIRSLPQEIGNLVNITKLTVLNNYNLWELPMSLGQIPGLTELDTEKTGIHSHIRDAILNQCRLKRDNGAFTEIGARLAKWKAIANSKADLFVQLLSDDKKKTLNEWLLRLEKTRDFKRDESSLAQTVCALLEDVFKNQAFAELFFSQAEANNACCEDRAAMALNEIYISWLILCKSVDLKMMTGVAKTLCLRKKLQKLIQKEERESVEIFLYYESTLKKELNLVTAIESMRYSAIGKRDWIDEESLVKSVNSDFFAELFELPLFEKMVLEERKSEWEAINAKFSRELEQLGDCPSGGQDDEKVLNYGCRQGEIMGEWKREKMAVARQWYKTQ